MTRWNNAAMPDQAQNPTQQNGTHPTSVIEDKVPTADMRVFTGIPTNDPDAALQFCQSLAHFLTSASDLPARNQAQVHSPAGFVHALQMPLTRPDISVVIPVYNEEDNLPALYQRLTAVLKQTGMNYEVVFVDDGSRDTSLEQLRGLAAEDTHIVVVELARNFGHQVAISAGLDHARGDAVAVMDADLQDPPEVLPLFLAKLQEGYDVVYAIREQRKESRLMRTAYAAFYRILQRVANIEIPLDAGDFCIMNRRMVDLLAGMPERNRFVRGIRSWIGLKQTGLAYERHARYAGKPKYTFSRLIYLALDGLVSFSYLPLRVITMLGFSVSLISILIAIIYAVQKLTVGLSPPGFATIVVSIFFLAGIQLVTIGVIGEYVGRIFEEVKRRPLYVVRRVIERSTSCES
ncbi:MAG: glycosyltransferase family 2 protein [Chloroflexaceae bacterium]